MIKAIIFDCFGVIITDALQAISSELRQVRPQDDELIRKYVRASNKGIISPEEAHENIAAVLGISVEEYGRRIAEGEAKDQTLMEYIAKLRPKYKTAMLSNISHSGLHRRFAPDELERSFDVVVVSGDTGFLKPEHEAFEAVVDRLGVRMDECVFVDDREDYCRAAQGLGMQTIAYVSFDLFRRDLYNILAE